MHLKFPSKTRVTEATKRIIVVRHYRDDSARCVSGHGVSLSAVPDILACSGMKVIGRVWFAVQVVLENFDIVNGGSLHN